MKETLATVASALSLSVLTLAIATPAFAQSEPSQSDEMTLSSAQDGWSLRFTPYAWLPGVEGDLRAGATVAPVDIEIRDLLDAIDEIEIAFMGRLEARRDKFSLIFDLIYVDLENEQPIPDYSARYEIEQAIFEFGMSYEVASWEAGPEGDQPMSLEIMGGGRYVNTDVLLDLTGTGAQGTDPMAQASKEWFEPFVGARWRWQASEDLAVAVRTDLGGFGVGSDLTWSFVGGVEYRVSPSLTLGLGYKILDIDFGEGALGYNVQMSGPVIGIVLTF